MTYFVVVGWIWKLSSNFKVEITSVCNHLVVKTLKDAAAAAPTLNEKKYVWFLTTNEERKRAKINEE